MGDVARLLKTAEAADAIGVGISTLQAWAASGRVTPAWRTPGGQARWDLDDLKRQLGIKTGDELVADASQVPIKHPIVAVIATCELGVLITKRRDETPPYGFLTGKIESGESPADAAVRECKEEAGLEIRAGELIAKREHPETHRITYYMAATPVRGTDVFVNDERELLWVGWMSLAETDEHMSGRWAMHEPVHDYLARVLGE
jgi:8-oxo-dGTP pyrophosphatase MutT (NUDIX family)